LRATRLLLALSFAVPHSVELVERQHRENGTGECSIRVAVAKLLPAWLQCTPRTPARPEQDPQA
jgi:hypothetical protein